MDINLHNLLDISSDNFFEKFSFYSIIFENVDKTQFSPFWWVFLGGLNQFKPGGLNWVAFNPSNPGSLFIRYTHIYIRVTVYDKVLFMVHKSQVSDDALIFTLNIF